MNTSNKPIRVAVIGSGRGKSFIISAKSIGDDVSFACICDPDAERLSEWKGQVKTYEDYQQVLDDPDIDAVCIATPVNLHVEQTIAALNAGKHVICEVPAIRTLEEGREVIAAVERTGLTYMMAENYCYSEPILQVQNMVEQGVFGELVYASGSYVHDCRNLLFKENGELTWRGEGAHNVRRYPVANGYPTHSLGPVARWLGINRTDFFDTTATWHSRSAAVVHYAKKNHPDHPEYADAAFWSHADTVTTCIRTEKEVLIDIRFDAKSARPHNMHRYELQGTRASFCWPDGAEGTEPLIWIEGRSPSDEKGIAKQWESLWKYRDEFQHPLWREHREAALKTGHGGGDFFTLREFVAAIREGREPAMTVYDAVAWSSIIPLSRTSVEGGNVPVKVPRFSKP